MNQAEPETGPEIISWLLSLPILLSLFHYRVHLETLLNKSFAHTQILLSGFHFLETVLRQMIKTVIINKLSLEQGDVEKKGKKITDVIF